MSVMRNEIYENIASKEQFRVLLPVPQENTVFTISLSRIDSLPDEMDLSDLEQGIEDGHYLLIEDASPPKIPDKLSEAQTEHMNKIWELIGGFVTEEPQCFDKKIRSAFIRECAENTGQQRKQIQRYLYRYWAGGMSKMALSPNFGNRGGKGKPKNITDKLPGRPVTYATGNQRLAIGEKEKKQIKHIMNTFYNKHTKYNMHFAYENLLATYYRNSQTGELLDAYPTETQFRYHAKKYVDMPKRVGDKKYARTMRSVTGNSQMEADGPGERYQVDATIADVYLVSSVDRRQVIGRPVLYFVIDVFSRMITGFYVGLEGPSWAGVMMALLYTFTDKVALCRKFDIEISADEWPCSGLPHQLVVDNGELTGKNSENLIRSLGIDVLNASAWRPDMKGIVEKSFDLVNGTTRPLLPGAVLPDYAMRGGHDYRLDAKLNLYEFTQIIINYIFSHNSKMLRQPPQTAEDVIRDDVRAIPIELWNWGVRNRTGRLRQMRDEDIMIALLPRERARVTGNGIRFQQIHFECNTAIQENWFSTARIRGGWDVDIAYDPRNLNNIYILHDDRNYEICERTQGSTDSFENWYYEDMQLHKSLLSEHKAAYERPQLQSALNAQAAINKIIETAEQESKVVSFDKAKRKLKVKNQKENRRAEQERIRKQEAFSPGAISSEAAEVARPVEPEFEDNNPYDFIVDQMQEDKND